LSYDTTLINYAGFPCILENLENKKLIILEMSLNFTKCAKNIACEKIYLKQKKPVHKYAC